MVMDFNRDKIFNESNFEIKEQNINDTNSKIITVTSQEQFKVLVENFVAEKNSLNVDEKLDLTEQYIRERRIDDAYKTIKGLSDAFESGIIFNNNDKYAIYSFDNNVEFMLKILLDKEQNKNVSLEWIGDTKRGYNCIYQLLAYVLIDLKDLDSAEQALYKALRWNPVSSSLLLELYEIELRKNNQEKAKQLVMEAFKYASTPNKLACCYRKLGYLYSEQNQFALAAALYVHSLIFEDSPIAENELMYIQTHADDNFSIEYDPNKVQNILKENNIPVQASKNVLSVVLILFTAIKDKDLRNMYLQLLKNLVVDDQILMQLNKIPEDMSNV